MSGKLTPKYWVLWDNSTSDIIIKTLENLKDVLEAPYGCFNNYPVGWV